MARQSCVCTRPQFFTNEDGDLICLICSKPPFQGEVEGESGKPPHGAPRPRSNKAPSTKAGETRLHPHPDEVLKSIQAAQQMLGFPDRGPSLPDGVQSYLPSSFVEKIWASLEQVKPGVLGDPELGPLIERKLGELEDIQFLKAHRDSGRVAVAYFGSTPEISAFHMKANRLDVRELMLHLGEAIATVLQAAVLRSRFGLSPNWPAEVALLLGPGAVPRPFCDQEPSKRPKQTLAEQIGKLIFGTMPLMVDDPRSIQYMKDELYRLLDPHLARIRAMQRSGQRFFDDTGRELEDPALHLYKCVQEESPEWLRQPVPNTATPHRVVMQRVADAANRRRNIQRLPGLIFIGHRKAWGSAGRRKSEK